MPMQNPPPLFASLGSEEQALCKAFLQDGIIISTGWISELELDTVTKMAQED